MDAIIPALLSSAATLLVCLINNHYQRLEAERKHSETIAIIEYRLDDLTKKMEQQNQIAERTLNLEKQAGIAEAELKRVNHRLEALEKGA